MSSKVSKLWLAKQELKAKIAQLEAEVKAIDVELLALIPRGERLDGVLHVYCDKTSIAYKEVVNDIIKQLLPKSKVDAAMAIVDAHTKKTPSEYTMFSDKDSE